MIRAAAARGLAFAAVVAAVGSGAASPVLAQSPRPSRVTLVPVATGTTVTLLGVSFPDPSHGFAVGAGGTILATSDAGHSWTRQESGSLDDLVGVSFADAQHGYAIGLEIVLATVDGGRSWQRQSMPAIESVPGEGPGRSDGIRPTKWGFRSVAFSDINRGVIVGAGGTVFSTQDAGGTWEWRGQRRFGYLTDVSLTSADHGHAVTAVPEPENLFVSLATSDGGQTWHPRQAAFSDLSNANLRAVAVVDGSRTYVAGGAGRIFVTSDDGQRWAVQRRDTTETFYGMAFEDRGRGVAVGTTEFSDRTQASLVSTEDGGETWASRLTDGVILWDVAFADAATAYAVGCGTGPPPQMSPDDTTLRPCQQSLLIRIGFLGTRTAQEGTSDDGPWLLVLGGTLLVGAMAFGLRLFSHHRGPGR